MHIFRCDGDNIFLEGSSKIKKVIATRHDFDGFSILIFNDCSKALLTSQSSPPDERASYYDHEGNHLIYFDLTDDPVSLVQLAREVIHNKKISREKKPYAFNPKIIVDEHYFSYFQTNYSAIQEQMRTDEKTTQTFLIFDGGHWISAELSIKNPDHPQLLIVGIYLENITKKLEEEVKKIHPNLVAYYSCHRLQYSNYWCSFFALHAAKKLQTISEYLPEKEDVFSYLDKHLSDTSDDKTKSDEQVASPLFEYIDETILDSSESIKRCLLPLPLIVTTQTGELWRSHLDEYPEEELLFPINKRGETIYKVIRDHISEGDGRVKKENLYMKHFRENLVSKTEDALIFSKIPSLFYSHLKLEHPTSASPLEEKTDFFAV